MKYGKLLAAVLPLLLASCGEKGQREPHQATLYDICEVAPESGNPAVLLLYPADGDIPAVLTAPGQSLGDNAPAAGTCILAGYTPQGGRPYVSDNITLHTWSAITNIPLKLYEADSNMPFEEYIAGWDADPVDFISGWRAGSRVCMRLKLPYSTSPRRMVLIVDPSTEHDEVPTAYMLHLRTEGSDAFDRQYYVAFDISAVWDNPACSGLKIILPTANTPEPHTTLTFLKSARQV